MQRTTLVPLAEFMAGKDASQMQASVERRVIGCCGRQPAGVRNGGGKGRQGCVDGRVLTWSGIPRHTQALEIATGTVRCSAYLAPTLPPPRLTHPPTYPPCHPYTRSPTCRPRRRPWRLRRAPAASAPLSRTTGRPCSSPCPTCRPSTWPRRATTCRHDGRGGGGGGGGRALWWVARCVLPCPKHHTEAHPPHCGVCFAVPLLPAY